MLDFLLNYGFAWLSVILGILLAIKFMARKLACKNEWARRLNKHLRKTHIPLGILLIVAGFVHGLNSSDQLFSLNLGTATWLLSILLGVNYIVRFMLNNGAWIKVHRILTILFLFCIIIHVIDVGGVQVFYELQVQLSADGVLYEAGLIENNKSSDSSSSGTDEQEDDNVKDTLEDFNNVMQGVTLADGTYTGVADGFGKNLTVSVTVENNRIDSIVVTQHNERQARFYARPIAEIPEAIIDSQSLDVDAISGATFTSVGIINAVNDALSQALISGELPSMKALPTGRR